jgi:hypothetical protein
MEWVLRLPENHLHVSEKGVFGFHQTALETIPSCSAIPDLFQRFGARGLRTQWYDPVDYPVVDAHFSSLTPTVCRIPGKKQRRSRQEERRNGYRISYDLLSFWVYSGHLSRLLVNKGVDSSIIAYNYLRVIGINLAIYVAI